METADHYIDQAVLELEHAQDNPGDRLYYLSRANVYAQLAQASVYPAIELASADNKIDWGQEPIKVSPAVFGKRVPDDFNPHALTELIIAAKGWADYVKHNYPERQYLDHRAERLMKAVDDLDLG